MVISIVVCWPDGGIADLSLTRRGVVVFLCGCRSLTSSDSELIELQVPKGILVLCNSVTQ